MTANILGRRVDDDMGAVLERFADDGCRRVVDNQGYAQLVADAGYFADWKNRQLRVRQSLRVVGSGAVVGGATEVLRIARVDEAHLDAKGVERVGEEVPGAAVEIRRTDNIVAGTGNVLNGNGRGGLARGKGEGRSSALDGSDALFQHIAGRIHDPRIDVPQFL